MIRGHVIAINLELYTLFSRSIKFSLSGIRYRNLAKVTHAFLYYDHTMVQFMTFVVLYLMMVFLGFNIMIVKYSTLYGSTVF